ncbi:hypothetical protein C0J52_24926 [Blattella germanica]|nr:hypothetical protein C0J52_24926 [Blattella germanica]
MYKTGGGTFIPQTSSMDEKIISVLGPQLVPLHCEVDSSSEYLGDFQTIFEEPCATGHESSNLASTCSEAEVINEPVIPARENVDTSAPGTSESVSETSGSKKKKGF